uniref:DNA mismatch repair proteins mutS family domain-containing protein n=1 Tax=Plectus sambesii TaxID=2011161 RepID=A0A914WX10_9BILA
MTDDQGLQKILGSKAAGTIAIFDKGDYYSFYGDDATLIARDIFHSEMGLKLITVGGTPLAYHTVSSNQLSRILRDLLLVLHHRVEIYKCEDGEWTLTAKGSSGNLADLEEVLGDSVALAESATVMAVKLFSGGENSDEMCVAVAFCDLDNFTFTLAEFPDSMHFCNLEAAIVSLAPRECVMPEREDQVGDYKALDAVLNRANIGRVLGKKSDFGGAGDIRQDLTRLLSKNSNNIQLGELEMGQSMNCLNALIKYMKILADDTNFGRFKLERFKTSQYMRLDWTVIRALELFSTSYMQVQMDTFYDMMNKCRSLPGQRMLKQWIRQPLNDLRKISERLDVVEALVNDTMHRSTLHNDLLRRVPDLAALGRRLIRRTAALQDCYRLYQLVKLLYRFTNVLTELSEENESSAAAIKELLLEPLTLVTASFDNFCGLVETAVDLKHLDQTGEFRVKPDIDPNLLRVSEEMDEIVDQMRSIVNSLCSSLQLDSEKGIKLEISPQHGYHMRVTRKEEKSLRNNKKLRVLDTKNSGVLFTTDKLQSLNDDYQKLKNEYDAVQKDLIQEVLKTAAGYVDALKSLTEVLASLDVLVSFAQVAAFAPKPLVRPQILEKGSGILHLQQSRHPCLELQDEVSFIPNDVNLSFEEQRRMLVLTGPNMGGKSTYLRATALTVLMGQMGSFVACDSAKWSLIDALFTRVGACDYQAQGVSTFMAEMIESALILESATEHSLVIFDELGRGTSTYDGFGLASAIAE